MNVRKHRQGCYRVTLDGERFAQIRRYKRTYLIPPAQPYLPDEKGREWGIEIRQTETGDVLRMAGVWPTLKLAIEDLIGLW